MAEELRRVVPSRQLTAAPPVKIPEEPGFAAILPETYWRFEYVESRTPSPKGGARRVGRSSWNRLITRRRAPRGEFLQQHARQRAQGLAAGSGLRIKGRSRLPVPRCGVLRPDGRCRIPRDPSD